MVTWADPCLECYSITLNNYFFGVSLSVYWRQQDHRFAKFLSELCCQRNMNYRGKVSTASKTPALPSNGIGFFDHFPKNFIRRYWGTEELITDVVNRRVNFYNCEMLKRPVSKLCPMSKLAQTTSETIKCLDQIHKPILSTESLQNINGYYAIK